MTKSESLLSIVEKVVKKHKEKTINAEDLDFSNANFNVVYQKLLRDLDVIPPSRRYKAYQEILTAYVSNIVGNATIERKLINATKELLSRGLKK